MSEVSNTLCKSGPGSFSFYANEINDAVTQLFKTCNNSPSGAFDNSTEELSQDRKEKLSAILKATGALNSKVNEMLYPVINMRGLQDQLRNELYESSNVCRANDVAEETEEDTSSSISIQRCSYCNNPNFISPLTTSEIKHLCNDCGIVVNSDGLGLTTSSHNLREKDEEEEEDFKFLKECDTSLVQETLEQYSDNLFEALNHMETHLESMLVTIRSIRR